MVPPGEAGCDTAFSLSIDHVEAGSGIGAGDRALTIKRVLDADARPDHFIRPGHVFPLRAKEGGVLERRGHTYRADGSIYFRVFVKPLVNLIWVAGLVFLLGSVITLWPDAREQRRLVSRAGEIGVPATR